MSPLIFIGIALIILGLPIPSGGLIAGVVLLIAAILMLIPIFR